MCFMSSGRSAWMRSGCAWAAFARNVRRVPRTGVLMPLNGGFDTYVAILDPESDPPAILDAENLANRLGDGRPRLRGNFGELPDGSGHGAHLRSEQLSPQGGSVEASRGSKGRWTGRLRVLACKPTLGDDEEAAIQEPCADAGLHLLSEGRLMAGADQESCAEQMEALHPKSSNRSYHLF